MKNAFLHPIWGLFLVFSFQGLSAQTTLTSASNPQIGQSWDAVLSDPTGFDPGPGGANQSWNFANLDTAEAPALFSFEVLAPTGNPLASDFPSATHIIYWEIFGFELYQYEFADQSERVTLGGVSWDPSDSSLLNKTLYTDNDDALKYPLTYQDSYTFSSRQEVSGFGFTAVYGIEGEVTADGYGSLTTPAGTFTDVLRFRVQRIRIDSSFFVGQKDTAVQYIWMQEGNATALLVYETTTNEDEEPSLNWTSPNNANGIFGPLAKKEKEINIFPNPGSSNFQLELSDFSLHEDIQIEVLDLQGKLLYEKEMRNNGNIIPLSLVDFSPGIYLISLRDTEGNWARKKLIKN
ncbi:MAG: T9SS type A sorting domain-containing protein [Bacteroidia bacterium]|nr:T9SS type A sorting domain-containing protein [Bacteroidia bacterium]